MIAPSFFAPSENFWFMAMLLGTSCILIIAKFRDGKTYRGA